MIAWFMSFYKPGVTVLHIPMSDTFLELLHVPPSVCIFLGLHLLHIYISMVDPNSIFFFPRSLFSLHSCPSDPRASLLLPLLYHSSNYLGREFYIGDHLSFGPR